MFVLNVIFFIIRIIRGENREKSKILSKKIFLARLYSLKFNRANFKKGR